MKNLPFSESFKEAGSREGFRSISWDLELDFYSEDTANFQKPPTRDQEAAGKSLNLWKWWSDSLWLYITFCEPVEKRQKKRLHERLKPES